MLPVANFELFEATEQDMAKICLQKQDIAKICLQKQDMAKQKSRIWPKAGYGQRLVGIHARGDGVDGRVG